MRVHLFCPLCGFLIILFSGNQAYSLGEDRDSQKIDEICVTAERRSSPIIDTSLSINAISSQRMNSGNVKNSFALSLLEPSLVFSSNVALGQPYIRGVGSDVLSSGSDPNIAIFIDDVYQARPTASVQDFFDLESVEIIKGPAGAIFGRNALGGLIRFFTKKPVVDDFSAEVKVAIGSYDKKRVESFVNIPVAENKAALRLSGLVVSSDGFTKNLFFGNRFDNENSYSLRGHFFFSPGDQLEILLSADFSNEDSSRGVSYQHGEPLSGAPGYLLGGKIDNNPRHSWSDTKSFVDVQKAGIGLGVNYLGEKGDLKTILGWRRSSFNMLLDLDGTNLPLLTNAPFEKSDSYSLEMVWTSKTQSLLSWLGGVQYFNESAEQALDVDVIFLGLRDQPHAVNKIKGFGLFGEIELELADYFSIKTGARYSAENKDHDFTQTINGDIYEKFFDRDSWQMFTPRFVFDYKPNNETLLYLSASKGFRAGGYNSNQAQTSPFDQETLWGYELGIKKKYPDSNTYISAAAFYYDYNNMLVSVLAPNAPVQAFRNVENASNSRVFGAEMSFNSQLSLHTSFGVDVQLLDAIFTKFISVPTNDLAGNPDQSGGRLPRSPKFSFSVFISDEREFGNMGIIVTNINYRYQSSIYFDSYHDDFVKQAAYGILTANIRFTPFEKNYFISIYGSNLTNVIYYQNKIRVDGVVGNIMLPGEPLTYGLELGVTF